MTRLLIFIFAAASCAAQTDTIITIGGRTIVGKILKQNDERIKYRVAGQWDQWISRKDVTRYTYKSTSYPSLAGSPMVQAKAVQPPKSAETDSLKDSERLNHIQYCLRRCHGQFSNGLILIGSGILIGGIVATVAEGDQRTSLMGIAGGVVLVGYINMLASHRWLKKAGTEPDQQMGSSVNP